MQQKLTVFKFIPNSFWLKIFLTLRSDIIDTKFEDYKMKFLENSVGPSRVDITKKLLLKIVTHQNFDKFINIFKLSGNDHEKDIEETIYNSLSKSKIVHSNEFIYQLKT